MNEPPKKILAIDDDPDLLFGLQIILKRAGFQVLTALNGQDGIHLAEGERPDMILCDIAMPGMDGFATLQHLRWNPRTAAIPLIFLTARTEHQSMIASFANGADDYITKPYDPKELGVRINAILRRIEMVRQHQTSNLNVSLKRIFSNLPVPMLVADTQGKIQFVNHAAQDFWQDRTMPGKSVFEYMEADSGTRLREYIARHGNEANPTITFEGQTLAAGGKKHPVLFSAVWDSWTLPPTFRMTVRDLAPEEVTPEASVQDYAELSSAYDRTLSSWARTMEMRGIEPAGHTERVTSLTVIIARTMGISEEQIVHLRRGALLHDVGKLGIPDTILLKQSALTLPEWQTIQNHPKIAYDLLSEIEYLQTALEIPYCHHEKWDGSGYPRHLSGEEIPLAARIFAVVDAWDALISDRPSRDAWSREQAREYLLAESGKLFDPTVVEIFLSYIARKNPAM